GRGSRAGLAQHRADGLEHGRRSGAGRQRLDFDLAPGHRLAVRLAEPDRRHQVVRDLYQGVSRRSGQGYHGPFGIQDGDRMQWLTCRDVLNLIGQPGRYAAVAPLVERHVQFLPGVLAHRQLEVPALVVTADAAAQRDLVLDYREVLGVEVGGAQVLPFRFREPLGAEVWQAGELRQDEVGIGVVFLLGLQVVALAARQG